MHKFVCLLILVTSGWSNAAENPPSAEELAEARAQVRGVANIYQEIRSAAERGELNELTSREWQIEYVGEPSAEGTAGITIEIIPTAAFGITQLDDRNFSVKLINSHALVTDMGQLREIDVKVSRVHATLPLNNKSSALRSPDQRLDQPHQ